MLRPPRSVRPAPALALAALALTLIAPRPGHAGSIEWRGLLDLTGSEWSETGERNTLTRGDSPYDGYRMRLFADASLSDHLRFDGQFVYADASGPYVDGAYLTWTPWLERDAHVEAGKVPWPIGTWAPRTYSDKNPLLTAPLMYQYHTTLVWYGLPANTDQLLATAGEGQESVVYGNAHFGRGMPVVDDSYWDVGVIALGSHRPLEYALGVVAGAPSWGSTARDDNGGKSVLGRIGLVPAPWLRLGVSGSYGPYLSYELASQMPPGKSVDDYAQALAMADLGIQTGHFELNAEGARDTWQTPTVGDLDVTSGYVELKLELIPGAWVAGRYDVERFGRVRDSLGNEAPWDADVTRLETGVGYRFTRKVIGKLVWQDDRRDWGRDGVPDERVSGLAAQLSVGF